jgi:hypothetical protein
MQSVPITLGIQIKLRRGVLDTILCDKFCQGLAEGRWFSPVTPISSTNKTDGHYITEILLKVALSTITNLFPFNKLKIMSEIAHDNWKVKTIYSSHKLVYGREDSSFECCNQVIS